MINTKRLLVMAKKWQRIAALGRRRITATMSSDEKSNTSVSIKGHLFVYSIDGKRFLIPLMYLSSTIFRELFRMSEEELGLPRDGPITLPCDSFCIEYIVSLLPCNVSLDVERALLTAIGTSSCSVASLPLPRHEQHNLVLCGF